MVAALERCLACEAVVSKDNWPAGLSSTSAFNRVQFADLSFRSESESAKSVHDIECRSRFGLFHELALVTIGLASEAALHGSGGFHQSRLSPAQLLLLCAYRHAASLREALRAGSLRESCPLWHLRSFRMNRVIRVSLSARRTHFGTGLHRTEVRGIRQPRDAIIFMFRGLVPGLIAPSLSGASNSLRKSLE